MKPRRSAARLERVVAKFNRANEIGTPVRYWLGAKSGSPSGTAKVRGPAFLAGGHTPVVWLVGVSGYVALTHVEVIGDE